MKLSQPGWDKRPAPFSPLPDPWICIWDDPAGFIGRAFAAAGPEETFAACSRAFHASRVEARSRSPTPLRLFALPATPGTAQRTPVATPKRIGPEEIQPAIRQLASAIERGHPAPPPILLGIANGGIALARRLAALLPGARCGVIDISFHRDDIDRNPIPKEFAPTQIPGDVDGVAVVLVDDVISSGRTVKAALDELFDHGRPAKVELAVLVDRGGRRLPVAPDYCGLTLPAGNAEKIVVALDLQDPSKDAIMLQPV